MLILILVHQKKSMSDFLLENQPPTIQLPPSITCLTQSEECKDRNQFLGYTEYKATARKQMDSNSESDSQSEESVNIVEGVGSHLLTDETNTLQSFDPEKNDQRPTILQVKWF